MGIFSGGNSKTETTQYNTATQATGGAGALSGNTGEIKYNYEQTDHGAVSGGLKIAGQTVGAVVHLATQQQAANVRALNTMQAVFSRQSDDFDGSASTIEHSVALQKQSLVGVVVLAVAAAGFVWVAKR